MSKEVKRFGIDPRGDLVLRMSRDGSLTVNLLRVCSSTLRRASTIWRAQFKQENLQRVPNMQFALVDFRIDSVSQTDDLISAVIAVMHMIHGNHKDVKTNPTFQELHHILIIVKKCDIYQAIIPYTVHWTDHIRKEIKNIKDHVPADHAIIRAQSFWEFGLSTDFYRVMSELLCHAYILDTGEVAVPAILPRKDIKARKELNDPLMGASEEYMVLSSSIWELPTPGSLARLLSQRRQALVEKILRFVQGEIRTRLPDDQSACK